MFSNLRQKAAELRLQVMVLYLAYKDPRVPWYVKLFALCVVGYAFSPIDLIPDFIPVLGYLDDLIIVPLGISLALKMIPEDVLRDCTAKAEQANQVQRPRNWFVGGLILLAWVLLGLWLINLTIGWRNT